MADFLTAAGCGGALTHAERLFIRDTAAELAARFGPAFHAVNIGVDAGGTLWCIKAGAPDCELVGIDINPDCERGRWAFIHGDSRRVHAHIDGPLALLLIDGDHDYYGVRADIANWAPKVGAGGVVLFHDYGNAELYPHTAGVKQAVDEWAASDGHAMAWEVLPVADSLLAFRRKADGGQG